MNYIKLQIGCIFVSLYIIILYINETRRNFNCNKYYDLIMLSCPWAIVFDGITAWTVNHLDVVPPALNLVFHCIFYVMMSVSIFIAFLYMVDITIGIPKKKYQLCIIYLPITISLIIIFAFLKDTVYLQGKITNYSMGISAITCYVCSGIYFITAFIITVIRRKNIEIVKRIGIYSALTMVFMIIIFQTIFPEILITSLAPTIILLAFYITMEDPAKLKIQEYNTEMVMGFSTLVENRDNNTGGHIRRTKAYVSLLLDEMEQSKKYTSILTKDFRKNMINAAPMHDLGKVSTPDYILQKPGRLSPEEYDIMKLHAPNGGEMIIETFSNLDEPDFLKIAYEVARFHHEKWNGKGYPEGLKESEIPLSARIMAVADVFDAVSAKRCYREAMPLEQCFKIIEDGIGQDFDPDIANLFLAAKDKVTDLYKQG